MFSRFDIYQNHFNPVSLGFPMNIKQLNNFNIYTSQSLNTTSINKANQKQKSLEQIYDRQDFWMQDQVNGLNYSMIDIDYVKANIIFNKTQDKIIYIDNFNINDSDLQLDVKINFKYHYKDKNNNELISKGPNCELDNQTIIKIENWIQKHVFVDSTNCKVIIGDHSNFDYDVTS